MTPTQSRLPFHSPSEGSAIFSPCNRYRYSLTRYWGPGRWFLNFIGLNPSTADAETNDPTVYRMIVRAKALGFDGLTVTNLFAFRSTDPRGLAAVDDPVGPDNDAAILSCASEADLVVVGWGSDKILRETGRADRVRELLRSYRLDALRVNQDGELGHPLYLSFAIEPTLYRARREAS